MTAQQTSLVPPAPAPAPGAGGGFPAVDAAVARARAGFVPDLDLAARLDRLQRLEDLVRENRPALEEALAADLGKPRAEAWLTELGFTLEEIAGIRTELAGWMAPEKARVPLSLAPARARVEHQPLGTVLVIAPWNYPVQLVLSPLAGALAAGNTVVVKPSEVTATVSGVLAELIERYLGDCVSVVEGGVPETTRLLEHRFDHVFYTGNGKVARVVMTAAARHLTPVTLELGGKSPVWVDASSDLRTAARRIVWGKFLNAGQTCVAPDHVLGTPGTLAALEPELVRAVEEHYGQDPRRSDSYGRIVSERHLARLTGLLEQVPADDVVCGGGSDRAERYLAPTVVRSAPDGPFMAEEIFGPVLPLVPVRSAEHAVELITAGEKPLALYVFSEEEAVKDLFRRRTSSGGLSFNTPLLHLSNPELPFGGVGASGTGAYHGKHSFTLFTHARAVLDKPLAPDTLRIVYPPYRGLRARLAAAALGRRRTRRRSRHAVARN
ncbi:aldehyde dehydrogenase family protein [Kocuria rosea]|uniref:aldehyde dehydrogenase family protein n=1 Tax=Kocuria rosea TaxID=1275 RepID=UPI00203E787F|nr:aldehyde dehydrogenase family protein [Kocuria rosea]MCM3689496.1 aldehyde dehydrogenase family protein [Kocuria rosea]